MTAPIIVFDLDGTLIDTAPDLVDTLNVVFAREGLPPVPYDTARNLIGGGARLMIKRGVEAEGRDFPQAKLDATVCRFHRALFRAYRRPFAALSRSHRCARRAFAPKATVSRSAPTSSSACRSCCLRQLGLADRFAAICGQDTFGMQKPDPEVLRRTIAAAGGNPQRAIMIGDSLTDIRTARAAGVPVIAVDFGYTDRPVTRARPRPHHQPLCPIAGGGRRALPSQTERCAGRLWLTPLTLKRRGPVARPGRPPYPSADGRAAAVA